MLESSFAIAYGITVVALFGLCMGSFLNCLAWRMVNGESVLKGRSHCATCGHELTAKGLVPLFSWLFLRGRCRYCGSRVSVRYPLVEALCACVFVSLLLRYGFSLQTVELIAFSCVLVVLSLTDLDTFVIPNATIVTAIAIRLVYLVAGGALGLFDFVPALVESLIGGVVVVVPIFILSLVMDHVLGRASLGGGDVKLLFVAGLYFGWQQSLFLVIVACVLGIAFSVVGQHKGGARSEAADSSGSDDSEQSNLIPFGPAIAAACWVTMLVGPQAVIWYQSLFLV